MRIRAKAGGHWVVASKRRPGKGSRKELVLNLGRHESIGAAVAAWDAEAAAHRAEAATLLRQLDAIAKRLGVDRDALRRGEVGGPVVGGALRRALHHADHLIDAADAIEARLATARALPPDVPPCRCGGGGVARQRRHPAQVATFSLTFTEALLLVAAGAVDPEAAITLTAQHAPPPRPLLF